MAVHNHGTEQADGPICPESLIGECLVTKSGEIIEALREQIQSRPLLRNMAKRLQSEVSELTAERDGLLAMVAAALAATKRGNIATPPWVIEALTAAPAQSLAKHDAGIRADERELIAQSIDDSVEVWAATAERLAVEHEHEDASRYHAYAVTRVSVATEIRKGARK